MIIVTANVGLLPFEIACVLVRFNHAASIVDANHSLVGTAENRNGAHALARSVYCFRRGTIALASIV